MLFVSLQKGKTAPTRRNVCPKYNTKPSDGEAAVLELWEMWRTPSLALLPGPLWTWVLVPVTVPDMSQIELFNHQQYLKLFKCVQIKLLILDRYTWNHSIVCQQIRLGSCKNYNPQTISLQNIFNKCMYILDLALNILHLTVYENWTIGFTY